MNSRGRVNSDVGQPKETSPIMDNRHAIVYYGRKDQNWENKESLTDTFIGKEGQDCKVKESKAPGIHFGAMSLDHEGEGLVFRVADVTMDFYLT